MGIYKSVFRAPPGCTGASDAAEDRSLCSANLNASQLAAAPLAGGRGRQGGGLSSSVPVGDRERPVLMCQSDGAPTPRQIRPPAPQEGARSAQAAPRTCQPDATTAANTARCKGDESGGVILIGSQYSAMPIARGVMLRVRSSARQGASLRIGSLLRIVQHTCRSRLVGERELALQVASCPTSAAQRAAGSHAASGFLRTSPVARRPESAEHGLRRLHILSDVTFATRPPIRKVGRAIGISTVYRNGTGLQTKRPTRS